MKSKIVRQLQNFFLDQKANTATEYAILLGLIIIVSLTAITALGNKIADIFQAVSNIG